MERKVGEVFDFKGKKLKVTKQIAYICDNCYLRGQCTRENRAITGYCENRDREDNMEVVFAEVMDEELTEQPAPQEEQKLNLCEKLKYRPEGTQFWSPLLGDVKFMCVGDRSVTVENKAENSWDINSDSTLTIGGVGGVTSVEPMLFPSREQRDWSKVRYERPVENLPKTWDEFVREMGFIPEKFTFDGLYLELSDCMFAGGDDIVRYCDQHIAMVKLHALRDCYRQGWEPKYNETCWNITLFKDGEFQIYEYDQISSFLSFGNQKTARAFLNSFEDLIKEAGDLI